jgi:membrane fusion protein, multidrug efflux system
MKTTHPLAIVCLLALSACGPQPAPEEPTPNLRLVKTAPVQQGPAASLIEVAGVGAFRDETRLSFKVGGVIEQITVREGEHVAQGKKLAWLNKQDVNAALSQAAAARDKAQRDFDRAKKLREQEVISEVQLSNLQTVVQQANAQFSQAQFASQTAEIAAPAKGVVLKRFAQVGEVVAPGQPIVLIGSKASGFVMRASLADRQAVHVQLGNRAEVEFDALPGVKWPGKVIELSQAADPATGTYGVLVSLDTNAHSNLNLLSGMQGRTAIEPPNFSEQRSYVPIEAVVEGNNDAAWIFTVNSDNTVKRQAVKVLFVQGDRLALLDPLPVGTQVVRTGAAYLQDGDLVEVQE